MAGTVGSRRADGAPPDRGVSRGHGGGRPGGVGGTALRARPGARHQPGARRAAVRDVPPGPGRRAGPLAARRPVPVRRPGGQLRGGTAGGHRNVRPPPRRPGRTDRRAARPALPVRGLRDRLLRAGRRLRPPPAGRHTAAAGRPDAAAARVPVPVHGLGTGRHRRDRPVRRGVRRPDRHPARPGLGPSGIGRPSARRAEGLRRRDHHDGPADGRHPLRRGRVPRSPSSATASPTSPPSSRSTRLS
ncbi:hypothetical protein SMICM304S_11032 [Streptomyces microflavus]